MWSLVFTTVLLEEKNKNKNDNHSVPTISRIFYPSNCEIPRFAGLSTLYCTLLWLRRFNSKSAPTFFRVQKSSASVITQFSPGYKTIFSQHILIQEQREQKEKSRRKKREKNKYVQHCSDHLYPLFYRERVSQQPRERWKRDQERKLQEGMEFRARNYVNWYWTVMVITFCFHQFLIGRLWRLWDIDCYSLAKISEISAGADIVDANICDIFCMAGQYN